MKDLLETRKRGYAFDDEEHLHNTWCVASPVFDRNLRPIAAVSISGNDRERVLSLHGKVKITAEVVTHIISPVQ